MDMFSLENKIIVLTGATGLLGRQFAKTLIDNGATVILADINYQAALQQSKELGNNSIPYNLDITDKENLIELKEFLMDKFGRIDVLINNAAINDMVENPINKLEESKFENYPVELFRKVLDVNVTGIFLTCQVVGKEMAKQKNGNIINIASTYGIVAPNQNIYKDKLGYQTFYKSCAYPTSKAAVIQLTRFLAAYWGNCNVRVNCLSPGGVENNQDETFINNYSNLTPLNRMAHPTDYNGAIVFLASDSSKYMTGANLVVDGGWTIW